MIAIFAKVPFVRQQRSTDPDVVNSIEAGFREAAMDFDATLAVEDECFLLSFAEEVGCARLRAAEALRRTGQLFAGLAERLHGWILILDRREGNPAVEASDFTRHWLAIFEDGSFATEGAAVFFSGYIEFGGLGGLVPVLAFPAALPALPAGYLPPAPDEAGLDRVQGELKRHIEGNPEAVVLSAVGPGDTAKTLLLTALERLYGPDCKPLILRAGTNPAPLGPFLTSLKPTDYDGSDASRAARFTADSPWRRRHSEAIQAAFADFVRSRLEAWALASSDGERPAVVLLEGLDAYPGESLTLLANLLSKDRESRTRSRAKSAGAVPRLSANLPRFIASSSGLPPSIAGTRLRTISAPPPGPGAIAKATRLAAAALGRPELAPALVATAAGDTFRLGLALRQAASGGSATSETAAAAPPETTELVLGALATWPVEFSEYLHAIDLSEEALDDEALDKFLAAAGFSRGIRPLLGSALLALGLLEEGARPRLARLEVRMALEIQARDNREIDRIFTSEILALHAAKRIHPSLALHRRLTEPGKPGIDGAVFLLDCIASDEAYGPSEEEGTGLPRGTLAHYLPVLQSLSSSEALPEALAAFEKAVAEAGDPPLETAILGLARASDEFARGATQSAAARIRPALMSLHRLDAKRAEARAHRILGMCSLSARQVQEGGDYLNNAVEMASLIPDPLEAFFAAVAAAGADFVLGDLRKAEKWQATAAAMAENAFRPDWLLGSDFLAGRLSFELGRYGQAEECFRELAERATALGLDEAALRSSAWAGRSASYAGAGDRARGLLAPFEADAEAAWFLGEIAAWEGAWPEASRRATASIAAIRRPGWRPTDAFSWNSGFEMLEGPALNSGPASAYLEDQVGAFSAFAEAMRTGDPAFLGELTSRTREQRLASIHPQAHLYDYYGFILCESFEESPVDPGTLLSRAWKALQMRTMRMTDSTLKNAFLEGNRWNREIVAAARARRLV